MADIVPFPAAGEVTPEVTPSPQIWVCNCGCSSFQLFNDDTVPCALCGAQSPHGGWTPAADSPTWEGPAPTTEISTNDNSVDFARKRVLNRANEDGTLAIVVLQEDGTISTWSRVKGEEQLAWLEERLERAADMIRPVALRDYEGQAV